MLREKEKEAGKRTDGVMAQTVEEVYRSSRSED